MEEFKDAPEELLNHLKLSEQECPERGPRAAQQTSEETFHDCHDSFEARAPVLDDEGNVQEDGSSSRKQTELEEEYLLELEKDMPEEEKQVMKAAVVGSGLWFWDDLCALSVCSGLGPLKPSCVWFYCSKFLLSADKCLCLPLVLLIFPS